MTRKTGEGIKVGDNIRIVVLEVKGSQVRLGIEAPHDLSIHRDEVWEKIMEENKKATTVTPDQMEILVRKFSSPGGQPQKKNESGNGGMKK
ncbi:carbon storage regulator CsrA [Leptospirillum ferriphilum]|uniref:carbon storage regulator CsrA n=1 Tax=Leptospirillum ferriphilum TaxID=178606 RepID=UPI003CC7FE41